MSTNSLKVNDIVAPIISGEWDGKNFSYQKLEGTIFLIGRNGIGLTAKHVTQTIKKEKSAIAFVENKAWSPVKIDEIEEHPSEDIAVLRLHQKTTTSWLAVSNQSEHQSCEYDGWGYPSRIAEMAKQESEEQIERPDLIYVRGYVRRRISRQLTLSMYQGESFYELSEVAGECCSGSPIIKRASLGNPLWDVFGIYIGENNSGLNVGYATRSDAFFSWAPKLINRSIYEESHDI